MALMARPPLASVDAEKLLDRRCSASEGIVPESVFVRRTE